MARSERKPRTTIQVVAKPEWFGSILDELCVELDYERTDAQAPMYTRGQAVQIAVCRELGRLRKRRLKATS